MKPFFFISIITVLIVNVSCGSQKSSTFWVNSQKADCQAGEALTQCIQINKTGDLENPTWEYFYGEIEGFTFKPGVFQKIEVKETKLDVKNVPADASSIKFTLLKIMEEKQDTKYQLHDIWVAKKVFGKDITTTMEMPNLEINITKMRVQGNDGCNNYGGAITKLTANEIAFGPMRATKRYCGEDNISNNYNKALHATTTFKRKGLNLFFYDAQGNETLTFNKVD